MATDREKDQRLEHARRAQDREHDPERLERLREDLFALSRDFREAPEQVGNYYAELVGRAEVSRAELDTLRADLGAHDPAFAAQAFATGGPARGGGGGQGLADGVRAKLEAALGVDLSTVRVHTDGTAEAMGAEAYAVGDDLHFAPGRYDPDSAAGRALIGHEVAHVVQQRAGRVTPQDELGGMTVNTDRTLEAEADRVGAQLASGSLGSGRMPLRPAPARAGGAVAQLKGKKTPKPRINLMPTMGDLLAIEREREKPIRDWLDANKTQLTALTTAPALIAQIKAAVPAVASWQDIEVSTAILGWGNDKGVEVNGMRAHHQRLLDAPKKKTRSGDKKTEPPIVTAIKNDPAVKAIATFFGPGFKVYSGTAGTVTISKGGLDVDLSGVKLKPKANVGPSGASVQIGDDKGSVSLSVAWNGTVTFKIQGKAFSVTTSVSKDAVTIGAKYKIGITGTQGTDLKKTFTEGEAAFKKLATAIGNVGTLEEAVGLATTMADEIKKAKKVFEVASTIKGLSDGPKVSIDLGVEGKFPTNPDPMSSDPTKRGPSVQGGVWLVVRF